MCACLIQQLFREKVGIGVDPELVDEAFFPLLRKRKNQPKELLQDIKLTRDKLIITDHTSAGSGRRNQVVPTFSPYSCRMQEYPGMVTSSWRRRYLGMNRWGAIDILNQLRKLKHPQVGVHRSYNGDLDSPGKGFEHAYIRLEENYRRPPPKPPNTDRTAIEDWGFVNDFLDNALTRRRQISWYGIYYGSPGQPVLSLN
jgi:hypothetical protein